MADEGDIAAGIQAAEIERALAQHAGRPRPEPRLWCIDCDDVIPAARRLAVATDRCACCQELHEKRTRR